VVEYTEGMAVGYRHYTAESAPVAFPFGFGLSYTTFEHSDLEATSADLTVTVANVGDRDGAEVVQVYVRPVGQKMLELKGFARVEVPAGGAVDVAVPLGDAAFRHWDSSGGSWHVVAGDYEVLVGASVADVRCKAVVRVEGVEGGAGDGLVASGSTSAAALPGSASDASRTGRATEGEVSLGAALTADSVVGDMVSAPSGLARLVARVLQSRMARAEAKGESDLNLLFVWNMPFARLAKVTGGMVDGATVAGIVRIVNGHFCGGLTDAARGFFANRKANRATARALAEASR
jgi:beta-glucosidase